MSKAIAIGAMGLVLVSSGAAAQTAVEQAQILRDFQRSVVTAATPAPKIFTLPVAMVFRRMIARALAERDGVAAISGSGVAAISGSGVAAISGSGVAAISGSGIPHRVTVLEPFPSNAVYDFPRVLRDTLPVLPGRFEYRLIGNDLVLRDLHGDVIVAVLRDALGSVATVKR